MTYEKIRDRLISAHEAQARAVALKGNHKTNKRLNRAAKKITTAEPVRADYDPKS